MPRLVVALLLLWALLPNPYVYYTSLRFVVCAVCIFTAYRYTQERTIGFAWLFAGIAGLFNPMLPIHLTREIWFPVDLSTAALLTGSYIRDRRRAAPKS